jgi:hypothetical protein
MKKNKKDYLRIFVVGCCDQIFDVEFCWITNFGVTELDDEAFVTNGWTSVKRLLDKNDECLEFFWSLLWFERSFVDDINVWIFGDVVPGGINVTNDDEEEEEEEDVPVELVCWGLSI